MELLSLLRIAFLLLGVYSVGITCTPPNPPATKNEQEKFKNDEKRSDTFVLPVNVMTGVYKVRLWLHPKGLDLQGSQIFSF